MRTISTANQEGGCGKTTTAVNLCATLAEKGERTPLIDPYPQEHPAPAEEIMSFGTSEWVADVESALPEEMINARL